MTHFFRKNTVLHTGFILVFFVSIIFGQRTTALAHDLEEFVKPEEVPGLINKLSSEAKDSQREALHHLGLVHPPEGAAPAIPLISQMLQDKNPVIRTEATIALGNLAKVSVSTIPNLIKLANDENVNVRRSVCKSLGKFGPAAVEAIPELTKRLQDENTNVRHRAAEALSHITPNEMPGEALPVLVMALDQEIVKDKDEADRWNPAVVLTIFPEEVAQQMIIKHKQELLPTMIKALDDLREAYRAAAVRTIGLLGPEAKPFIPELLKKFKDENTTVRHFALQAVGKIGVEAKSAAPEVINSLSDPEIQIRIVAAYTLGQIKDDTPGTISALRNTLKDEDEALKYYSIISLGNIGPSAREVAPELIQIAKGISPNDPKGLRAAAIQALSQIGEKEAAESLNKQ